MYQAPVIELVDAAIAQQDTIILKEVNLEIFKGEFVYLIGRTGSGKSSLLRCMYGDLELSKGTGKVANFDLRTLDWKSIPFLRRKLGIIFQDFHLLMDRSVGENLKFALEVTGWEDKAAIAIKVEEVLANVGMLHKKDAMPYRLSGGEQQRVAIARALLNEPEIVIADEPTGNLDPVTSEEIFNLLWNINQETQTTFLIGTHDFYTIEKYPGRIIKTYEGTILEQDTRDISMGANDQPFI